MKAIKWADRNIEKIILVVLLFGILGINTAQIFYRFGAKSALPWVEELSRYLLIWSGFIGVSYTIRYNTAMRLTLIFTLIPRKARNVVSLLVHLIMLAFFVWMAVNSFSLLAMSNQRSATMGFSIKYVYSCTVFCGVLSAIRCLQGIVRIICNFKDGDDSQWDPTEEPKMPSADQKEVNG
ncbi:TRAP transporter small permease [Butyricicoccus faecihominis]|uniref:TRAP transporter small permease n=1 Tax=Butyricicoccus faecihominis TaxID=1712515 RepID=UPI002478B819|nr:TRAP transporter small permease [Butyricicoccus faecihominis]MCQ5130532.1 TRAP transporter small permease [Butyricicoccus faecihominis]